MSGAVSADVVARAKAALEGVTPGPWKLSHAGKRPLRRHTLVCEAFHGLRPDPDWQVRHLNGNPLDNRAENLAWGTCFENHQDRIAHGTSSSKTACPRGHAYDKVRITKYGHTNRRCSICDRETMRRLTERRRVARLVGGGDAA